MDVHNVHNLSAFFLINIFRQFFNIPSLYNRLILNLSCDVSTPVRKFFPHFNNRFFSTFASGRQGIFLLKTYDKKICFCEKGRYTRSRSEKANFFETCFTLFITGCQRGYRHLVNRFSSLCRQPSRQSDGSTPPPEDRCPWRDAPPRCPP